MSVTLGRELRSSSMLSLEIRLMEMDVLEVNGAVAGLDVSLVAVCLDAVVDVRGLRNKDLLQSAII